VFGWTKRFCSSFAVGLNPIANALAILFGGFNRPSANRISIQESEFAIYRQKESRSVFMNAGEVALYDSSLRANAHRFFISG